jgi:membrane-bound lytic murein transglycosylase B
VIACIALALALAVPQEAARPSFADFLAGIREEALTRGIKPEIVDAALANIDEPVPVVIDRDRAQAETVLPLERYIDRIVPKLVEKGRAAFAAHKPLLDEIGGAYGVDPRIIVGIWGMESNFGHFSGQYRTVAALTTLAWDPRRATMFRAELFKALEILNRGDIDLEAMRGSWAGAMGQVQFMPSSYLQYAQDYDGDGRRDIWSTPADVFASIANYLVGHGWVAGEPWGREVRVSKAAERTIAREIARRAGTCQATRDMTVVLPAKRWEAIGVRTTSGGKLPAHMPDAALVSGASRHFLVYHNYDTLLEYNCAHSYALSVGLLADRVRGVAPTPVHRPSKKRKR